MRELAPKYRRWLLPTTALGVTAIVSVLVLLVWPAILQAQGGSSPMPGGPGATPGGPGGPGAMSGPGGAPGGMPGATPMGGAPGGMPGGAPGGMGGGMGAPGGAPGGAAMGGAMGGPGAGASSGTDLSASSAPGKGEPMYPYRLNPFNSPDAGAEARVKMPWIRRYGPNWDNYPIGLQVSTLPRPERPTPKPPPPPPPAAERILRVSSIAWAGGQPIATYETPDGRTGVLKPGEFVGDWQVIEILRDHVVVRNRNTGDVQDLYLRPREKMPVMPNQQPGMMPGMMQPGMQPGMMQPGMMQPGMQPGMMQPGMQPGMMQPGMQPGMMQPGMMGPGRPGGAGDGTND